MLKNLFDGLKYLLIFSLILPITCCSVFVLNNNIESDTQITYLENNQFNYYKEINGYSGINLVIKLNNLITKTHNPKKYSDLWRLYSNNFIDYNNEIIDIYSSKITGNSPYKFKPIKNQCGNYKNEGDCYNREHIIPQTFFKKEMPMVADAHHIFPTDGKVNGIRSDFVHDEVKWTTNESCTNIKDQCQTLNGSKFGKNKNGKIAFEPIDDFKGDVARAYLYFAIRYYPNIFGNWGTILSSPPYINNDQLQTYLKWHNLDNVDSFDKKRNDAIEKHQNNRNPFIDIPNLSQLIWDNQKFNLKLQIKDRNKILLNHITMIRFNY